MDHHIYEAKQNADGRLIPSLIFALGDYAALAVAGILAVYIRNCIMTYSTFQVSEGYLFLWLPLVFMFFNFYSGLYGRRMLIYRMVERLFFACLEGTVLGIILMFFAQVSGQVSRLFVVLYTILAFTLMAVLRVVLSKVMKRVKVFQIPVLIVGAGKTAELVVQQILRDSGMRYRVVGFLEDRHPVNTPIHGFPVLGGFDDMEKVIQETGVRTVLIATPGLPQDDLSDLIYRAQSLVKQVDVVPNLVAVPMSNVTAESFFDAKIMVLHIRNNLASPWNQLLKRIFDIVATICGGILISPILLAIAIWVYHDSPGPVIFKNKRIGLNGEEFNCYKFRSMYMNNQEILARYLSNHPMLQKEWETYRKLRGFDPRITPVGKVLRKYSLDELPQLLNVLKGEMSLVGPRPYLPEEIPMMGENSRVVLMAKPGITGYWQVSGRNDVTFDERVDMESWYVYNWSVWIDFLILWKTIKVVFSHEGAY